MVLHTRWRMVVLGVTVWALAHSAEAARVRSLGLGDMASRAGRIFVGRCVDRVMGEDAATGVAMTTYTFVVTEPIKGVSRGQTTFRVPGTPEQPLFSGLPVFRVGEEALLLLYPESPAGFSVALGLDQGRFRIRPGPDSRRRATNDRGNAGLLRDVPPGLLRAHGLAQDHAGPVALSELEVLLGELVARAGP